MTVHPLDAVSAEPVAVNLDLERALLGTVMLHGAPALDICERTISPDDFADGVNRALYLAMQAASRDGRSLGPTCLKSYLLDQDFDLSPGASVLRYLGDVICAGSTLLNCSPYAAQIADLGRRRRVAAVAAKYQGRLARPAEGLGDDIARQMLAEMDEATVSGVRDEGMRRVRFADAAPSVLARVQDMALGKRRPEGISTSIPNLDRILSGGLHRQKLVVVAGRPGMGKSSIALTFAIEAARAGNGVLFVSLEMGADELTERALSMLVYSPRAKPLTYADIRRGVGLDEAAMMRLDDASRELQRLPLEIEQEPGLSMAQIASRARIVSQRFEREGTPLGLIIIDHIGIMRTDDRYRGNRVHEIGEITRACKNLSRSLGCTVLALSQLNRQAENREDKRPMLADLRDAGTIEQDADVVLGIYREAYYLARLAEAGDEDAVARLPQVENLLEIHVLKQRGGQVGRTLAFCDIGHNIVAGLSS